jgi:hypothetical protein
MNLLSRRISSKSLTGREDRGRGEGQNTTAAERAQSESKPSLLHRLRKSSRSRDRDGQKEAEVATSQPNEVSAEYDQLFSFRSMAFPSRWNGAEIKSRHIMEGQYQQKMPETNLLRRRSLRYSLAVRTLSRRKNRVCQRLLRVWIQRRTRRLPHCPPVPRVQQNQVCD